MNPALAAASKRSRKVGISWNIMLRLAANLGIGELLNATRYCFLSNTRTQAYRTSGFTAARRAASPCPRRSGSGRRTPMAIRRALRRVLLFAATALAAVPASAQQKATAVDNLPLAADWVQ